VSSLPGYEVGSALSVPPNVTQNRSCHEKGRSARIYVIIRDGTAIETANKPGILTKTKGRNW
jgi:hypothetical protein